MTRFFNGLCIFLGQTEEQYDCTVRLVDVDETGLAVFPHRVMRIRERQTRLGFIDAQIQLCFVAVFLRQIVGNALFASMNGHRRSLRYGEGFF